MLKVMKILLMGILLSSCQGRAPAEKVVSVSKFGEKFKNLHQTIVITKPGTYDYEGVMHVWQGDGSCKFAGLAAAPVMEIRSDNVTVKNFGFKDATGGILILDKEEGDRENVAIINVEGRSCSKPLTIPARSKGLRVQDSILIKE